MEKKYPIAAYIACAYTDPVKCGTYTSMDGKDVFAVKTATPTGSVWVKGVKGFPIRKKVVAKFKHYDDPLRDWIIGTASSATGDMICFDWHVSAIVLDINHERWGMLEWLDESQSQPVDVQPKEWDNNRQAVIKKMVDFIRDCAANWDCDTDGHKYNTGCRKCDADEINNEWNNQEKEARP